VPLLPPVGRKISTPGDGTQAEWPLVIGTLD
jgi:hypothetical protein